MIEAIDGGTLVSCDFCSEELELRAHTIERVNEIACRKGWVAVQDDKGHWEHTCPSCLEDQQPVSHLV